MLQRILLRFFHCASLPSSQIFSRRISKMLEKSKTRPYTYSCHRGKYRQFNLYLLFSLNSYKHCLYEFFLCKQQMLSATSLIWLLSLSQISLLSLLESILPLFYRILSPNPIASFPLLYSTDPSHSNEQK